MKLLYISPTVIEWDRLDGVAKKILGHVTAFSKEFEVLLLYRNTENVMLYRKNTETQEVIGPGSSKYDTLKAAFALLKKELPDCCYIRFPQADPVSLYLFKQIKKQHIRLAVEIPTYPYDAEGLESLRGRVIHVLDRLYRGKMKKYVDRIVTYSDDAEIFGIKTINTVNGLDFAKVALSETKFALDDIHLCGVAAIHRIHGYDRLIRGMHAYYAQGGDRKITFDIVGFGDETIIQSYKDLVAKFGLEDKVIFHGRVHGQALDDIYNQATMGVNSLAIHRQNLKKESTLKTREYAAKGLPILSSSFVDAFCAEDNDAYVCQVPFDDSDIDVQNILSFMDTLLSHTTAEEVKNAIRTKAQAVCDMSVTLQSVVDFFQEK